MARSPGAGCAGRRSNLAACLLLAFSLALSARAAAQDDPPADEPVQEIFMLDKTHAVISRTVDQAAKWFDHFFTPPRERIEAAYSYIIFKNVFQLVEAQGFDYKPVLKAKIHLPGLKRRASLVIEGEEQDRLKPAQTNLPADAESDVPAADDTANRSVGIQYTAARWLKSRLDFKVAVRSSLKPVASVRYRKKFNPTDATQIRFTETGYWKYSDGFGETTRLDFEQQLNPLTLFRWSNAATYSEISTGLEWSSVLGPTLQLSRKSAVDFSAAAFGATRPKRTVNNYRLGTLYRRNFFRRWLFYEVEPAVDWPRQEDGTRLSVLSLTFRVEIQFRRWE